MPVFQIKGYTDVGLPNIHSPNVHIVREDATHRLFAAKRFRYGHKDAFDRAGVMNEANITRELKRCPYVVRLYTLVNDKDTHTMYLIMEYCPYGSLEGKRYDEVLTRRILRQLATAISAMHSPVVDKNGVVVCKGYIHQDIKPSNILLCGTSHNDVDVRLADFGLAYPVGGATGPGFLKGGTGYYASPAALTWLNNRMPYTPSTADDVWSFGVVAFQLVYGYTPFLGTMADMHAKPCVVDDGPFADLIRRCLDMNATTRATTDEILGMLG